MKYIPLVIICCLMLSNIPEMKAQTITAAPAKVDFDAYEALVAEVKQHRAARLIGIDRFEKMSKEEKVVILDTRSSEMYLRRHIKGAINLNFSDFTQENLMRLIPDPETKILIYCNNNIEGDEAFFPTKVVKPLLLGRNIKALTLALNIPTYINLYGYGYRNVYELSELVPFFDKRIAFESTDVELTN